MITQFRVGVFLAILLVVGASFIPTDIILFRLIAGVVLGFALTRGSFGFGSCINRAYLFGSTKLLRMIMILFIITSLFSGFIIFAGGGPSHFYLDIHPINFGLFLGSLMFGFGLSIAYNSTNGVIIALLMSPKRSFIGLIFFSLGVFVGLYPQTRYTWITTSVYHTKSFTNGVFLPDLFGELTLKAYIGGAMITALVGYAVIYLARYYEAKNKFSITLTPFEKEQYETPAYLDNGLRINLFSTGLFKTLFFKPWTLWGSTTVIIAVFILQMLVTKKGWFLSTQFGHLTGKVLWHMGVSLDWIVSFTGLPAKTFDTPIMLLGEQVQNFAIFGGGIISLLISSHFTLAEKSPKFHEMILLAIGAFVMGVGTRLANGGNMGGLYTPVANMSLSGWIFFFMMMLGGLIGNIIRERIKKYIELE